MIAGPNRVNLSDAYWFQEGPGVRNTQFKESGIKLLNVANITKEGQIDLSKTDRHLDDSEARGKYGHFLVDEGDLVIASSGISIDSDGLLRTRGAFIENGHLPLCMNTSTIRFKAVKGKSDLSYLRHWLQSSDFRVQITRLVTGSAQKNFGPTHLKSLSISLPSLDDQKRIAAILNEADELRRKRQRAINRLKQLGQSIFHEMFGDPSINPFNLPAFRLGELASFGSGGTPSKSRADYWSGTFPWVSPKDMKVLRIRDAEDHISEAVFKETSLKKIQINTPLIVVRGMILAHTVPIAMAMREIAINQDMKSIHFDERIFPEFGLWCLKAQHDAILKKVDTAAHGTKRLDTDVLKAFPVLVPHMDEQRHFADRIWTCEALQERQYVQLDELQSVFSSLQHRAFQGEL